jgi:hypothetical protein
MFKVKIKSNISAEVKARLKKTVDDKFIADMNNEVVGEIKRMINAGVSPVQSVEGGRRFKKYKDEKKYPAKQKAKRPVNLYLTGEMLRNYVAERVNGVRLSLGISKKAPKEVKDRAEANNVGTVNSEGQVAIAARRFVPLNGETYAVSVIRKLKNLYARRIKELILKK